MHRSIDDFKSQSSGGKESDQVSISIYEEESDQESMSDSETTIDVEGEEDDKTVLFEDIDSSISDSNSEVEY